MEKNLKELSPRRVWEKFYEITRVPRPSHHEDAIREYLLAEAHTHGIEAEADAAGNVIMRKAATSAAGGSIWAAVRARLVGTANG